MPIGFLSFLSLDTSCSSSWPFLCINLRVSRTLQSDLVLLVGWTQSSPGADMEGLLAPQSLHYAPSCQHLDDLRKYVFLDLPLNKKSPFFVTRGLLLSYLFTPQVPTLMVSFVAPLLEELDLFFLNSPDPCLHSCFLGRSILCHSVVFFLTVSLASTWTIWLLSCSISFWRLCISIILLSFSDLYLQKAYLFSMSAKCALWWAQLLYNHSS